MSSGVQLIISTNLCVIEVVWLLSHEIELTPESFAKNLKEITVKKIFYSFNEPERA